MVKLHILLFVGRLVPDLVWRGILWERDVDLSRRPAPGVTNVDLAHRPAAMLDIDLACGPATSLVVNLDLARTRELLWLCHDFALL